MNYFLVDYENVHTNGFSGIASLSEKDKVIIFYSENASTMTFGLHRRLNESKAEISFQKVPIGSKNALDFQLCTYLGYLIGQNEQSVDARDIDLDYYYTGEEERGPSADAYYIISGDQDYAVIAGYWARRRVSVSLIPEISAASAPPAPAESPAPASPVVAPLKKPDVTAEEVRTLLKSMLPARYRSDIPAIAEIIRNGRTKQNVHSELTRAFHQGVDTSIPREIYQSVKPLLLSDAEYLQIRLESVLPAKYRGDIPAIADIIRRCPTKQAVNGELIRAFHEGADNSKASEIYRCVRPLLTDKA